MHRDRRDASYAINDRLSLVLKILKQANQGSVDGDQKIQS